MAPAPLVRRKSSPIVQRLAEAGYAAVAPDLYHRLPPEQPFQERLPQLRDPALIADIDATVDYLRKDPAVDGERLGILGFCMGGMNFTNPARYREAAADVSRSRALDFLDRHLR